MITKALPLILVIFICFGCNYINSSGKLNFNKDEKYPRWLSNGNYKTDQTSGITFIGYDEKKNPTFLLVDDIGKIHRMQITSDTIFNFTPVNFTPELDSFFSEFPKIDFEEISLDRQTNTIYLSIEGNGENPLKYTAIFKLKFKDNNIFSDTIVSVTKLDIHPEAEFYKYVKNNLGFEGVSVDENYFYFGFEGFFENGIFADSAVIFIVDKKEMNIVKEINTKELGIHTICGLYSDENYSLYGIDRNNKNIFHLMFNEELEIVSSKTKTVVTNIPGYPEYDYVVSLESITMDDKGNMYLVDDPWRSFFIPPGEVLQKLDEQTVKNFKEFIPVIYKFTLKN